MRLLVIGLSHKTAPVREREKASLSEPAARAVLRALRDDPAVSEAAALSTCNRTELYAAAPNPATAESALERALTRHTRISAPELSCARYLLYDERAAAHLFRVGAGLDSMVLGESEIQAQVAAAAALAIEEEALGPLLGGLFRQAAEVGRRVRRETRIGAGPTSVSSVAVELARRALGDLAGRRAILIGAGRMAEATARALLGQGLRGVTVANRTVGTARALATTFGGTGVGFEQLDAELAAADIVISSTDAPHAVLARDDIERVMRLRGGRPLVLVDIAVPRDLEPGIGAVEDIVLYDIDDLERVVEANLDGRRCEAERAAAIVAAEVERFRERRGQLAVTPAVTSLWARAEAIRKGELAKAADRWESLSPADLERLDAVTRSIVRKVLHEPSARVRAAASGGNGLGHVESFRYLFALGDERGQLAPEVPLATGSQNGAGARPLAEGRRPMKSGQRRELPRREQPPPETVSPPARR